MTVQALTLTMHSVTDAQTEKCTATLWCQEPIDC